MMVWKRWICPQAVQGNPGMASWRTPPYAQQKIVIGRYSPGGLRRERMWCMALHELSRLYHAEHRHYTIPGWITTIERYRRPRRWEVEILNRQTRVKMPPAAGIAHTCALFFRRVRRLASGSGKGGKVRIIPLPGTSVPAMRTGMARHRSNFSRSYSKDNGATGVKYGLTLLVSSAVLCSIGRYGFTDTSLPSCSRARYPPCE